MASSFHALSAPPNARDSMTSGASDRIGDRLLSSSANPDSVPREVGEDCTARDFLRAALRCREVGEGRVDATIPGPGKARGSPSESIS